LDIVDQILTPKPPRLSLKTLGPIAINRETIVYPFGLILESGMLVHIRGHLTPHGHCSADRIYLLRTPLETPEPFRLQLSRVRFEIDHRPYTGTCSQ
jgi:hypothetical protein